MDTRNSPHEPFGHLWVQTDLPAATAISKIPAMLGHPSFPYNRRLIELGEATLLEPADDPSAGVSIPIVVADGTSDEQVESELDAIFGALADTPNVTDAHIA